MLRNIARGPPPRDIIGLRTVPYADSFFRTYNGPLTQEFNQLRGINADVDISTVGSIIERTMNSNAVSSFDLNPIIGNIPRENQYVATVAPLGYPWVTFGEQNGDEIDHLASIDLFRVIYNKIENGTYKVKFLEPESMYEFNDSLNKLAFVPLNSNFQHPLVIVPPQLQTACITMSCIVNTRIDWDNFKTSISYQNLQELSTLWNYRSIDYIPDGTSLIRFDVDPISFCSILEKDFLLQFNGQMIDVAVETNPWADDVASYIVTFLRNQ
ncbi:hypothetical protein ACKWTF_011538 [Chironomus riparius]